VRVAVLGLAHVHVEAYVAILNALPDVELIGCAERDDAAPSRQFFDAQLYRNVATLLAERPDAVIVCSETVHHRALVEQAAAAGAHVLCEKPIATTLEDAVAMRDACLHHGVTFMTAFPMRFDASVMQARQTLQSGSLGQVLGIVGVNHSINPSAHDTWFADPALAGGGAVMDHVVHLADLYRWWFGSDVREIYASLGRGPGDAVETSGVLLVTLSNGLSASIDCSWSRPPSYPRWGHLKMEVVAEQGVLRLDPFAEHLTVYAEATTPAWVGFAPDANRAMLTAFLDSVRLASAPPVTWLDGYRALQVALGAYASDRSGQPETVSSSNV